jgi:phosphoserine phosphatase RsbU/P
MHALPALRRLSPDIHAFSRPARTFTGDFYFTHRQGDRLWIALGDVAGKGLPAAIVMAMIQEELEQRIVSCANADCDPSRTMQRLHDFLVPLLPQNRFATAIIGWLADDGTLTLANAGHCPPLVVRADGTVESINSTGPIAGVLPGSRWHSVTKQLDDGDALLLYSDGVTEAIVDGEELGTHGLREIVKSSAKDGAAKLADSILAKIPKHEDDLTLVVVRP